MARKPDNNLAALRSPGLSPRSHPYSSSIASPASSSSSSLFSIDAPSSQSSAGSESSRSPCAIWENENEIEFSSKDDGSYKPSARTWKLSDPLDTKAQEPELEMLHVSATTAHPRRSNRNGGGACARSLLRPPPTLVRQCERKESFVDSLVDTTTQMIETIWPLSILSCTRENTLGKDQNLIGLRVFVQEVLKRSKTSYSTLQVALYYLVLIQSCIPKHDFTMEQAEDSPSCRAMQCGRRMFLAALILASKYLQDQNFSARAWSKISGLKTYEINSNEMAFLAAVNWKLHIPEPVYNRWTDIVFRYSPSSQPSAPSRLLTSNMWKAIIPHLTPDLDQVPFGYATICNGSGYREPVSPPALDTPHRHTVPAHSELNEHKAAIPHSTQGIPRTLEPVPVGTEMKGHTLPPLPRLGLLPTPSMTPHARPFCAPAASTFNQCSGRSSMSIAMAQAQTNSLARSTLDNPNFWKPTLPEPFPTSARRSSLAQSVYSVSSPESMISDSSARSSRSSSISSVASSSCALPQARLAVQATRRCTNLKLASRKDSYRGFVRLSPSEDTPWEGLTASPDQIENDYFSRPISYNSRPEGKTSSDSGSTPSASTREAAAALRDLALNHLVLPLPAGMSNSRKRERSHSVQLADRNSNIPESTMNASYPLSRKRERTLSSELSVQANVRELIAHRCVNDVSISIRRGSEDDGIVLLDTRLADSFLVPESINFEPKSFGVVSASPTTPRKRACCATENNTEESSRVMDHLLEDRAYPGPGMWHILKGYPLLGGK